MIALLSSHTCGPACWEAREDTCRCECGGRNHGCLRTPNGTQPVRRAKIMGDSYSLESVGHCVDIEKQGRAMNYAAGCKYYGSIGYDHMANCVAKVRPATQKQIDSWPELASYRDPANCITGRPYLLWKLAPAA